VLEPSADPVSFAEASTGLPVVLTSHGPRAGDKRWRYRAMWDSRVR